MYIYIYIIIYIYINDINELVSDIEVDNSSGTEYENESVKNFVVDCVVVIEVVVLFASTNT